MTEELLLLKKMFRTPNGARRCKDVKKLAKGLTLCDGANNHPFLESWFYWTQQVKNCSMTKEELPLKIGHLFSNGLIE